MPAVTSYRIIGIYTCFVILFCRVTGLYSANPAIPENPRSSAFLADPEPKGDFTKLVIPMKRVQNLFMIEARIDSLNGNFVLDTGAPNLVLNKTYFNKWRISEGLASYGITGGGSQVYYKHVDSLVIDELYYESIDADLVDLGHLENIKGVKILGLLGANLFFGMEMEMDLQNSMLILYKLDSEGNRIDKSNELIPGVAALDMPIEIQNDIIFIQGTVGEKKLRFCLDTGAESNALSNAVNNKILAHFSLTGRTKLGGSGYQSMEVLRGELDVITFGGRTFEKLPLILTDMSHLQMVYNTQLNGMLGVPFLMNGKVIINFKKKNLSMYFYTDDSP